MLASLSMRLFALTLTLAFAALACTMPSGPSEELERAVSAYNDHIRWARFEKASAFIKLKQRAHFMELYEPSDETLHIDDLEVKSIDLAPGNKKAKVTINARYFKTPSVTLQKKKWVQTWQREDDAWWMVSPVEEPFFPSPTSQPTSPFPSPSPSPSPSLPPSPSPSSS